MFVLITIDSNRWGVNVGSFPSPTFHSYDVIEHLRRLI